MPVYEEIDKTNGQKRYFIRTYVNVNGKQKQITRHNKSWLGRNGYLSAMQEEIRLKNNANEPLINSTLEDVYNSYIQELSSYSKLGTIKKHKDNLTLYVLPFFVNMEINRIDNKCVLNWKNIIEKYNFSLNYKKGIFVSFSALMNHAHKYFNLKINPVREVGNFKQSKGIKKKEMNIMSESQFNEFIKVESNNLYKVAFTTLFYTGIRRGELLALTWNDIDFKNKTIIINKTLNPKLVDTNNNAPKTDKSNRKIKVLELVLDNIKTLDRTSDRIFGDIKLTTLKRKCDSNCKKINVNDFRIHDFRHSFVSMCIDHDISINIISEYVGHENITTTLNTYSHLYPNSQEKLIEKLGKKS